jgi:hypothetical protein
MFAYNTELSRFHSHVDFPMAPLKRLKISIKSSTALSSNAGAFEVGVEVTVIAVEV